jgi:excinuclease ABC subunit C
MCLAPCYQGCSDQRYREEAGAVERFLATRGESRLVQLKSSRDQASGNLEFEAAAAMHAQVLKAEAVRALAPELVRPLSQLRAVVLQPPAVEPTSSSGQAPHVSLFLYLDGRLRGPVAFSTLGMRIQNEQSGSSSLYAQPMALEPVPEEREQGSGIREQEDRGKETEEPFDSRHGRLREKEAARAARTMLEERMEIALAELSAPMPPPDAAIRQGHLALLKRWYYRPEAKRPGEIFFPGEHGEWPIRALLRAAGRIAAKSLTSPGPS